MNNQLTCEQVTALLNFYIEDTLSSKLKECVRRHLENCPECMEKFISMQNIMNKFIEIQNEEIENPYATKQYEDFKSNLSAYVDNELNSIDSIKIKKIAISNPLARQDLENIYTFKRLLHSSFEKTKNELKNDFSKITICQLKHDNADEKINISFYRLTAVFFMMITFIVAGVIKMLYF